MKRWWILVGALVALPLLLSGCSGGVRQESWPGLLVEGDVVYAAATNHIAALDAATGAPLWTYPLEPSQNIGPFYAAPVFDEADNLLLVAGFKDRAVYALRTEPDLSDQARVVWRFPEAVAAQGFHFPWEQQPTGGAEGQYVSGGVIAGDLFLIGNGDGNLYALRLADGSVAWSFTTGDRIWSTPVVDAAKDVVYIASLDHHLYALALADGALLWDMQTDGAVSAVPALVGNSLWVGDFNSTLYEISTQDGSILWRFSGASWFWSTPVISGTTLFQADGDGNVYALDMETRSQLWTPVNVGDTVRGQPVLSPDGALLLVPGYTRGLIHALDPATGAEVPWGLAPATPGRLPGNLTADGERVYAMPILVAQYVRAYGFADGRLLWEYPIQSTE